MKLNTITKEVLLITGTLAVVNCGGDGGEPVAPPKTDHAPTTETNVTVDGQNLIINNTNNDIDGDQTNTNIKVTNSQLQEIFNQNFSGKTIQHVLENLPADTYVIKTVTTSTDKKAEDSDQANIEAPITPTLEKVDLPDLTYKKSLDKTTVTEDVSYTSVGDNTGHAVVVKKTVNGVKTEYVLTGVNSKNEPQYDKTKASLVNDVEKASMGDALLLDMADRYQSGGYGLLGFKKIGDIVAENGEIGTTIVNQHGETVSIDGYRKGIQHVRETLGVIDDAFLNGPSRAPNTGNDTKENWRTCRVFTIEFGKKMQQTGATDKTTVFNWAIEAFYRVRNMTPAQQRACFKTTTTEAVAVALWD